jgi:hypothetical protein
MGIGGSFPWVKSGRGVTLTTDPHLVPTSRMIKRYISSTLWRLHGGSGTVLHQKISVFRKYYWDDKMENMMGGEYSMHGTSDRYAKCIVEKSEPKRPLENLVVYGRIILKWP